MTYNNHIPALISKIHNRTMIFTLRKASPRPVSIKLTLPYSHLNGIILSDFLITILTFGHEMIAVVVSIKPNKIKPAVYCRLFNGSIGCRITPQKPNTRINIRSIQRSRIDDNKPGPKVLYSVSIRYALYKSPTFPGVNRDKNQASWLHLNRRHQLIDKPMLLSMIQER